MAYIGNVVIVDPDGRNLEATLRDADAQNVPVLYWDHSGSVWNWQDSAGVVFAGSGTNPANPLPDLVALRAALDASGVDIP